MPLTDWDDLEALIAAGPARPRVVAATVGAGIAAALRPPPPRPWRRTARPVQVELAETNDAAYILFMGGRGSGKTYSAANAFAEWMQAEPGYYGIVAKTFGDCRQTCVEGPSGLLRALGDDLLDYNKGTYEIKVRGGSTVIMASDDAPARLRGPNLTACWCDELGSWKRIPETYDEGVEFATRIGSARRLITTTPKRGNKVLKELVRRSLEGDPMVKLLRARTEDNLEYLSPVFRAAIMAKWAGTSLGRQELDGELLQDAEGAIVTTELLEATRVRAEHVPELRRVMVGVDPAITHRPGSDDTGIIVVGIGGPPIAGYQGPSAATAGHHLYVLADESVQATPRDWAARVLKVAEQWAADAITPEVNQGGDLVTTMLQMVAKSDGYALPRLMPVHAAVGKRTRAEPVAGVFEQHRAHIVGGMEDLEDQWTGWCPGDPDSPDQLDACVWAAVGLMPELGINSATPVRVLTGRNGREREG